MYSPSLPWIFRPSNKSECMGGLAVHRFLPTLYAPSTIFAGRGNDRETILLHPGREKVCSRQTEKQGRKSHQLIRSR